MMITHTSVKGCPIPCINFCKEQDINSLCAEVNPCLIQSGIVIVQLQFADACGATFQKLVQTIGKAEAHNAAGLMVWDVKYDSAVDESKAARSQTLKDFPMHTDAAFDEPPPKFVGLFVVKQDCMGGGISRLVDGHRLVPLLSKQSRYILQNSKYTLRVPEEFHKGESEVQVSLLDASWNFRYRREIIVEKKCSAKQLQAISELDLLLADPQLSMSLMLPESSILLLDNGRFLHARSHVIDKTRHLLRMRFQTKADNCTFSEERFALRRSA